MKNVHYILFFAFTILAACGSSDGLSNRMIQRKGLVGYSENALILRSVTIATDGGFLNITCYLNDFAQEECEGHFNSGMNATSEQVRSILGTLQVDPKIGAALGAGCRNKTLLLAVEPKFAMPEIDDSEFCFWGDENNDVISCDGKMMSLDEAEASNNRKFEKLKSGILAARKEGLDKFMDMNPDLVGADKVQDYLAALYGALDIKIDACSWQQFIEKNRGILDIVELRGLVDDNIQKECTESVKYKVLLKADNYGEWSKNIPSYQIISSKEGLVPFKQLGLTDGDMGAVDFSKDVVLYLSGGERPTVAYSLQIDDICVDSEIEVHIVHCAGQDGGEALSDPVMLIELPKNDYRVLFSERALVCE